MLFLISTNKSGGYRNLTLLMQDHKSIYNKDIEILIEVEELITSVPENKKNDFKSLIDNRIMTLLNKIQHPVAAENVFGMCIAYPNTYIRYRLIDFVEKWVPYFSAVETIINLTQDPDDLVSFKAMDVCANHKIEESVAYLSSIIDDVRESISYPKKPVGLGAQKVLSTLLDIFGVEKHEELVMLKNYFDQNGILPNNFDFEEKIPQSLIEEFEKTEEDGMILIPGGFFEFGLNENEIPDKTFNWKDAVPRQKVWLPPFFIDKYPVTNKDYDIFIEFIEENGHIFCHPNEPQNKQHRRNTYWDDRYLDNHPVTGIDFYDAFAYARYKGKELPTEFQWEKAARGEKGNVWPWGDKFDPAKVQYAGSLYNEPITSLKSWRENLLKAHADKELNHLTSDIFEQNGESPYGVCGMIGGTWEWTRSELKTKRAFHPIFENVPFNSVNSFAVLKGGSFFSHPGLMFPSFRAKDIPFCRHNEMGIRCVKNIPVYKIRESINGPITNKAIY